MKRQDSSSQKILKALTEDIRRGRYAVGHAFPSETTLARRFAVSRTLMATIVGELSRLARANGYS